jgi:threonine aldolase
MMAAAASAALDQTLSQIPKVHAQTRATARELERMGYKFALPVQTNMAILDLDALEIPSAAFIQYCKEEGVAVFPSGRLVFHHQTSEDGTSRLLHALQRLITDKKSGQKLVGHKVTSRST